MNLKEKGLFISKELKNLIKRIQERTNLSAKYLLEVQNVQIDLTPKAPKP
jgi:hypothetical protein